MERDFIIFSTNQFFDPKVKKKSYPTRENIDFTRVIVALAFLGHRTSHSQNKLFSP